MINSSSNTPVQAFPVETTTSVYPSGTSAYEVEGPVLVHMLADGNITCHYNTGATTPGSIVVPAIAGSDFAIANDFDSIDVDANCIISKA